MHNNKHTIKALVLALVMAMACAPQTQREGVLGDEGAVFFNTFADAVFEERLLVGSTVDVSAAARVDENAAQVLSGTFESSDESILRIDAADAAEGTFSLIAPGEAFLIHKNAEGVEQDRILVRTAQAQRVELLDGMLVGSSVDSRVPESFALVKDVAAPFFVSALDQCGGTLVSAGATPIEGNQNLIVENDGVTTFVTPLTAGAHTIRVLREGADALEFEIEAVEPQEILDVDIEVAASSEGSREVWARAFTLNQEVLGMSFDWSSSARVSLDRREGPNVIATISFPEEGEAEDDRPAEIDAELFGVSTELDLLSITSTEQFVFERQPPPEVILPPSSGCGGETCDPYAEFAGFFIFFGSALSWQRRREKHSRKSTL